MPIKKDALLQKEKSPVHGTYIVRLIANLTVNYSMKPLSELVGILLCHMNKKHSSHRQ
jgi:hypothetical protein